MKVIRRCPRCQRRLVTTGWTCPTHQPTCAPCYAELLFTGWRYDPKAKKYVPMPKKVRPHESC